MCLTIVILRAFSISGILLIQELKPVIQIMRQYFPVTDSNKKEKAPWAMSKEPFHRSFRTSKHNTVVPELEHVSSPTHNDTEITLKKGQTLLERTECIQTQVQNFELKYLLILPCLPS